MLAEDKQKFLKAVKRLKTDKLNLEAKIAGL